MAEPADEPYVGKSVLVKGVGRRWKDGFYKAKIADIREDDDTIKIQYASGGYRRFPKAQFEELLHSPTPGESQDSDLEFGSASYELDFEYADPIFEIKQEVGTLRSQIHAAIENRDFLKAHELKKAMEDMGNLADTLREHERSLQVAINTENFLEAHKLQGVIDGLKEQGVVASPKDNRNPVGEDFSTDEIVQKALKRALGGGMAGAAAMGLQVGSLMWMRTTMNYQYRYGTTTKQAIQTLYKEGGIRRFYRGVGPALFQGPLSRFGDTAANAGVLTLLNTHPDAQNLPVAVKTVCASLAASTWRIFLMPIDTVKTTLQVEGAAGLATVTKKAKMHGPGVFYHGALAASAATFAGHYPWFFTYNFLDSRLPVPETLMGKLGRNAGMGFCSSAISDSISNSIRVVKTFRQTHTESISYPDAVRHVVKQDGVLGLMGRGLQTRVLANGVQGIMFSVLWKFFDEQLKAKE